MYTIIGLSTQSKYASTILKFLVQLATHNNHVDDTKHHLTKYSNAILAIITMFLLALIVIQYFNIAQS